MIINEETVARAMAAEKMGLIKDPKGRRLPDDLWQQMLPAAREYLAELAFELHKGGDLMRQNEFVGLTPIERAQAIAAEANKCCTRSDGYEEAIVALALKHINAAIRDFLEQP